MRCQRCLYSLRLRLLQEEHAAEAYDIAALKSKGRAARINFGLDK